MSTNTDEVAVSMTDIVKTFSGVVALNHVDFEVKASEIHGLVGKNGAGKSTLVSLLSGFYSADHGEIRCGGRTLSRISPEQAKDLGIAMVPQQVQLLSALSIAENILCGHLPTKRSGFVDWKEARSQAAAELARLGVPIHIDQSIESLSVAERQMLGIARAFLRNARVMILDEPTAALPKGDVARLFEFIRDMRGRGVSFIYISHYLEELFALCERVTVLRDAEVVGVFDVSELDMPRLVGLISGAGVARATRHKAQQQGVALEVHDLTRATAYHHVDFSVNAGEVVGLAGLEGSGKAEIVRSLFGLEALGTGSIIIGGHTFRARNPAEAFARGVAYLPRDRYSLGVVGERSVAENVTLCVVKKITNRLGFISKLREKRLVAYYVDALGIKTANPGEAVGFLSGGNQQKVVFAKLAATRPRVLLLEEPTQGVDVQAKEDILAIIRDLATDGVGVVVVSDVIDELMDVCDRILVMYRGSLIAEFSVGGAEWSASQVMLAIEGNVGN